MNSKSAFLEMLLEAIVKASPEEGSSEEMPDDAPFDISKPFRSREGKEVTIVTTSVRMQGRQGCCLLGLLRQEEYDDIIAYEPHTGKCVCARSGKLSPKGFKFDLVNEPPEPEEKMSEYDFMQAMLDRLRNVGIKPGGTDLSVSMKIARELGAKFPFDN